VGSAKATQVASESVSALPLTPFPSVTEAPLAILLPLGPLEACRSRIGKPLVEVPTHI
jgi:hypothetical protein